MSTAFDAVDRLRPGTTTTLVEITDHSSIGAIRRTTAQLTTALGLDERTAGRAALIANEGADNVLKHAHSGSALLRPLQHGRITGVEIIFVDRGPGMADVSKCLGDGYSSAGTRGNGLGAIKRAADVFDVYSQPGNGTVVLAQLFDAPPERSRVRIGAVSVPMRGENVCGDGWSACVTEQQASLTVADGLGHGSFAAEASRAALGAFETKATARVDETLDAMHRSARATRGAAAAVASVYYNEGRIEFAGVGNIAGTVISRGGARSMVSLSGIVGGEIRKIQRFDYPWSESDIVTLQSDGIGSQWRIDAYPGLTMRHPSVIAAMIFRDFCSRRDDATIVVMAGSP